MFYNIVTLTVDILSILGLSNAIMNLFCLGRIGSLDDNTPQIIVELLTFKILVCQTILNIKWHYNLKPMCAREEKL